MENQSTESMDYCLTSYHNDLGAPHKVGAGDGAGESRVKGMDPPSSGHLTSVSLSITSIITLVGRLGGLSETASEQFLRKGPHSLAANVSLPFDFCLLPAVSS